MESSGRVTKLLEAVTEGDRLASEELLPLVYDELRRVARARLGRLRPGQTLQPTALVHEAYIRLVAGEDVTWANRAHFFTAAAEAMRRILIERARRAAREKHGGGRIRVTLGDDSAGYEPRSEEMLALDAALDRLEEADSRMATLVKLRYFAGLTQEEVASAMDISRRTVNRLSVASRAWLADALSSG